MRWGRSRAPSHQLTPLVEGCSLYYRYCWYCFSGSAAVTSCPGGSDEHHDRDGTCRHQHDAEQHERVHATGRRRRQGRLGLRGRCGLHHHARVRELGDVGRRRRGRRRARRRLRGRSRRRGGRRRGRGGRSGSRRGRRAALLLHLDRVQPRVDVATLHADVRRREVHVRERDRLTRRQRDAVHRLLVHRGVEVGLEAHLHQRRHADLLAAALRRCRHRALLDREGVGVDGLAVHRQVERVLTRRDGHGAHLDVLAVQRVLVVGVLRLHAGGRLHGEGGAGVAERRRALVRDLARLHGELLEVDLRLVHVELQRVLPHRQRVRAGLDGGAVELDDDGGVLGRDALGRVDRHRLAAGLELQVTGRRNRALLGAGDLRPRHVGVVATVGLGSRPHRTLDDRVVLDHALVDLDPRVARGVRRPVAVVVVDGLLGRRLHLPALVDLDPRVGQDVGRPLGVLPVEAVADLARVDLVGLEVGVVRRLLEVRLAVDVVRVAGRAVRPGLLRLVVVAPGAPVGQRTAVPRGSLEPLEVERADLLGPPTLLLVDVAAHLLLVEVAVLGVRVLHLLLVLVLLDALGAGDRLGVLVLGVLLRDGPGPLVGALLGRRRVAASGRVGGAERRHDESDQHDADGAEDAEPVGLAGHGVPSLLGGTR